VATPLFGFEEGKTYRMQVGHVFVFVDGQLLLEVSDPDPIDSSRYRMIVFEA